MKMLIMSMFAAVATASLRHGVQQSLSQEMEGGGKKPKIIPCDGAGPQSPRNIDTNPGTNGIKFPVTHHYEDMKLRKNSLRS